MNWQLPIGAQPDENGVRFRVWAPDVNRVEVVIYGEDGTEQSAHAMSRDEQGYYEGYVEGPGPGVKYMYRLDGDKLRPDPASRYQPEGVHGPSQVIDTSFPWPAEGDWKGLPLEDAVLYEVHVGTATPQGTFQALISKIPYLRALGITAVEILPVADFPGDRNWGYDGVDLYAPARAYGGPEGLKKFVDAAHAHRIAVVLDVVYNHLGPDGNYLRDFSRDYFTAEQMTPWGDAVNFANREVREFFILNATYWAHEYHVDGLRLDATHTILDGSEEHMLEELPARVRESLPKDRHFLVFAEDERNEKRLITPREQGGAGIDAAWADDFHHQVRSALAGDNEGYYADYSGSTEDLAATITRGWFYTGQVSRHSNKPRGTDPDGIDPPHFVYCIQNHDQVGNRPLGNRLSDDIPPEAYRAASALLLLSPYTPLLFQGQEWATSTPFLFFTDFDAELGKLVTHGRREEFARFKGFRGQQVPDPQAGTTFEASKLNWEEIELPGHKETLTLYRALLGLRRELPALKHRTREDFLSEQAGPDAIAMRYRTPGGKEDLLVVVNLKGNLELDLRANELSRLPGGRRWKAILSTNEPRFGGEQDLAQLQEGVDGSRLTARGPVAVALQAAAG